MENLCLPDDGKRQAAHSGRVHQIPLSMETSRQGEKGWHVEKQTTEKWVNDQATLLHPGFNRLLLQNFPEKGPLLRLEGSSTSRTGLAGRTHL